MKSIFFLILDVASTSVSIVKREFQDHEAMLKRISKSTSRCIIFLNLLPARGRPQGLVIIGVCLSVRTQ